MKSALERDYSIYSEIQVPDTHFSFSTETRQFIDNGWQQVISQRPHDFSRGLLFDRPLLRVTGLTKDANSLHLALVEDVSYKDVVGLRAEDFIGNIHPKDMFQVASLILVVETDDGSVLLRERDSGDWPHSFELPGGFITSAKLDMAGGDVFKLVRHIAKNELGLGVESISSLHFEDILLFESICEYMQVFRIKLAPGFELPVSSAQEIISSQEPLFATLPLPLHLPSRMVLERMK